MMMPALRFLALAAISALQAPAEPARAVALYMVDGRISYHLIQPGGGMWTPGFVRIDGADTSRNGLQPYSLDLTMYADGNDMVAEIGVMYGGRGGTLVPVGTFTLNPGRAWNVEALTALGIQPVKIAVVDLPAVREIDGVTARTSSPDVDVRVEPLPGALPRYRVRVTNRGTKPIMTFRASIQQKGALVGQRRITSADGAPVVPPGGTHSFDLRVSIRHQEGTGPVWMLGDHVEIAEIGWFEGR
jgi:hypothetical protein